MQNHVVDDLSRTLASGASRRQLLRLLGGGVAVGAVAATGLGAVEAKSKHGKGKHGKGKKSSARAATDPTNIPITGTAPNGGTFTGTFNIDRFAVKNGGVVALGTLTGLLNGTAIDPTQIALPVDPAASTGSCQILDLVLGPLDLNLLGLMVHLDQVHLNITAQSGSGDLLGNLLCAVANLLNGSGNAFGRLANLLNQILGALGL